ncbi:RsmB/NOP family class I SAM-dependent RNA methyltransferase [Sphingosinithalassobacter sp. CS137]|uniref:RsmB/NOP family class I SAM-dependent RNA methyltransferase n=1 Tax=Sphingosinithalassobacter sp. CS137 TaxID=2762748 RepID=UPI00165EA234|nr:RsmB/NOP family class I SAM-dependent RNA methyltransferase [Sphingosinithalassobacter sp. CS137]
MTPAARIQTAIELLDAIAAAARDQGPAADTILARGFASRRYAGSKDRRAIRELVYDAIRLCGERPESGRAAMLALAQVRPDLCNAFDGSSYGPATIDPAEPVASAGIAPDWLAAQLTASGIDAAEQAALLARAPLDVRANRLKARREALAARFPDAEPLAFAPDALRFPPDTRIEDTVEFQTGQIEVQDAGSQLVSEAAGVEPGATVIDLCAGAGGKTLALGAAMANNGLLLACDIDRARLSRLPARADRAGLSCASPMLLDPGREAEQLDAFVGRADVVVIDAPCSGTGTWRRNPEARWRLTPTRLERLAATQRHLLAVGARLVRPGGTLLYVVCSLLDAEGADQIDAFLREHGGWAAVDPALPVGEARGQGVRLTPGAHSTDGFFVAKMQAP